MVDLPSMSRPPVHEVVCGVGFSRMPGLSPVEVGRYWSSRDDAFAKSEIHPAAGPPTLAIGSAVPPLRTWLVLQDEAFLVQIQGDRFYLNWRRRGSQYPRFNTEGGGTIRDKLMTEFHHFGSFCERRVGSAPTVNKIELAKINILRQGMDWSDEADLARLFLPFAGLAPLGELSNPTLSAQLGGKSGEGTITTRIDLGTEQSSNRTALKFEIRVESPASGELDAAFDTANTYINRVFSRMIPASEMQSRFQIGGNGGE